MPDDAPTYDRPAKDRGLLASEGSDPTLASYLSSLVYLLALPAVVGAAFGGYLLGWYEYQQVIPVLAGLLVALLLVVVGVMHVMTRGN